MLTTRLLNLNAHFTRSLYEAVCRSVFERHKPLFSFLICTQIMQGDNLIDPDEWRFLVGGGAPTKNIERPGTGTALVFDRCDLTTTQQAGLQKICGSRSWR